MNPAEMVVAIVALLALASVFRARYNAAGRSAAPHEGGENNGESQRLREEVKMLKERLAVLERITIEKENSLEREIERLRDR